MATICPTITTETPQEFSAQMAVIEPFATRIHVDIADGTFAPRKLLDPAQLYFPEHIPVDVHVMYDEPVSQLMTLISLRPQMVIIHAEAKGDLLAIMAELKKVSIRAGVALLPNTQTKDARELIAAADHVLIFAGQLGYQGGEADVSQLYKVDEIKAINRMAEIGWDGGVNLQNVKALAAGGIEVINVGSAIHQAAEPQAAFAALQQEAA